MTVRGAERLGRLAPLTIRDVAACLKVSPRTVERIVAAGELEVVRDGRHVHVERAALIAFIDSKRGL